MISGSGFLISNVSGTDYYTRDGALSTDSNGYLVDANGGLIQGWSSVSKYTQRTISTVTGGTDLVVTDASLELNTNTSASNIQITTGETCPAKATSTMTFAGNLDAALKATDSSNGGMIDLGSTTAQSATAGAATVANAAKIPLAQATLNTAKATLTANAYAGNAATTSVNMVQVTDLTDASTAAGADTTVSTAVVETGINIATAQGNKYIWDDSQALADNPPATTFTETVYDSNGLAKEITVECWQVNDLGDGNVNSTSSQAAYAWYAFDTTGGKSVSSANLVGGTGITETYDRGNAGTTYTGDLLYFNTDGSLASQGDVISGSTTQAAAHLYLPATAQPTTATAVSPIPTVGAEIMDVTLDLGTAGTITSGKRDGVYSDAAGSYSTVNGVSTYVPSQSISCTAQNGYTEGTLESWSFDTTGKIQGVFSNNQTIVLGQLAMARVSNEEGLVSVGNNYYTTSANSGDVYVGTAGSNGIGTTVGGELEGSNVDLTTELTNMIIAQRGFEANSKSITTSNEMMQTVIGLVQ
jgi:flagellar hook protein FlgE